MKKAAAIALALALLVAGGGAWWYFGPFLRKHNTLVLPGTVEIQEVRLGSKQGGRVKSVAVREGQRVKAGDVLVIFETPELDAQNEQLKAKLAAAQAELDKAENGPRQEEKDEARAAVESAEARMLKVQRGWREEEKRSAKNESDAAEADLVQARSEFNRIDKLMADSPGAVTKADFDTAKANRDRAINRWMMAQAKYDMIMNGSRPEDIAEATAEVAKAKAKLALLLAGTRPEDKALARAQLADVRARLEENEAQRRDAIVRSPSAAVVEVLSVRTGDLVPPNAAVARILGDEDLWVKVFVPENELGKVRLGQHAEVTVDSYPGKVFPGIVDQIASASEFTPRNVQSPDERRHQVFAVKVRVDNRDGVFKSGMAAEVTLPLSGAP